MDTSASCFLLPLMAELLSLYIVSLSSSLIGLAVGNLSCFPEGGATAPVCGFPFPQSPACFLSTETSLDCFLSIRALSSHHTWNVYKDLAAEWGRCGFNIWAIWVTHGPGQGDPWVGFSQSLMGEFSAGVLNAVSWNHIALMPFNSLICPFPTLLPTPSDGGPASIFWWLQKENGFLQLCPSQPGKLDTLPFLFRRGRHRLVQAPLCAAFGKG